MNNDGTGINPSVTIPIAERIIDWIKDKYTPERLIDIGTGLGHLVTVAHSKGIYSLGVEGSQQLVNQSGNTRVQCHDIRKPVLIGPWDITTSFEFIEHVPREDLEKVFFSLSCLSPIHICTIHINPPEHMEHQTIQSREEWLTWFTERKIKATVLLDFPITEWTCSVPFELNLTQYVEYYLLSTSNKQSSTVS